MMDLQSIHFDAAGLVPAIVQDENGQVLMLAYMNAASLQKTIDTGLTWFYSRSRNCLWQKGETSGNIQTVQEMFYDCDGDAILIRVKQRGVACHTGTYSCFSNRIGAAKNSVVKVEAEDDYAKAVATVLYDLYEVINERRLHPVDGSYTNYLFEHGQDKILKKIGEEATETVIASKNGSKEEILYEMADLWYHCLVLLAYHNILPSQLLGELQNRRKGGVYHQFVKPE